MRKITGWLLIFNYDKYHFSKVDEAVYMGEKMANSYIPRNDDDIPTFEIEAIIEAVNQTEMHEIKLDIDELMEVNA